MKGNRKMFYYAAGTLAVIVIRILYITYRTGR